MKKHNKFHVYILRCADDSYYTGVTNNINLRIKQHNSGTGAASIKYKLPAKLVFSKEYAYYKNALNAEKKIKKYNRSRKEELIKISQYDQQNPIKSKRWDTHA